MRSYPFFVPFLISALAIISPIRLVCGCSIQSADVQYTPTGNKNQAGYYNPAQVSAHMNQVMASNLDRYVRDGTSTLSCVDARSDDPVIGTPGGDLAEFAIGLHEYNVSTHMVQTYEDVQTLFKNFMDRHISDTRPFYFHTDETRLKQVITNVSSIRGQTFTILPHRTPPAAEAAVWVAELVKSYAQGCGHIRLMIDAPSTYGLRDARIIQWLIRAFYEELWAADTDAKRAKLSFVVKLGSLTGRAVAIVSNKNGTCAGFSPAIPPSLGGSTLFVYTPSAASAFRSQVMLPFFANQGPAGWNTTSFLSNMDNLFGVQLTATLTNLDPANKCSLVTVEVTTGGSINVMAAPSRASSGTAATRFTIKWMVALVYAFIAFW